MSATPHELSGFRLRLNGEEVLVGALLTFPDSGVAAVLGRSGFDFIVLDGEHGPFTLASLRACLDALDPCPAAAVARVAANDPVQIKQVLDLGFDGVIVPGVSNAEEAAAAVRSSRLAPGGERGLGLGRAAGHGADLGRYLQESDAKTGVILMIEDREGVENAPAIAAVEGVDALFVGPLDLSASLGVPGELTHPRVGDARDRVAAAAHAAGVAVGTACAPSEAAGHAAGGLRLLAVFVDGLGLASAAAESVRIARGQPSPA
jgi:2-keto-3-deoxy-L-rhamnonate aldolase RhmA